MTAASAVRCACCRTPRPAAEVYERVSRSGEWFCRDTAGCRRRMAGIGDPVGEVAAAPPPAVAGARCAICGTVNPPGGAYERTPGMFGCRDRAGCAERSVESQFLTAHREDFPEVAVTKMTTRMHEDRNAGAPAPAAPRRELTPEELAALAWQESAGRRAGGTSAATVA